MRIEKIFGETGQVKLIYYLKGHHDHPGDRAHSKAQKEWYKYLKAGNTVGDPQQFCEIMFRLDNYTFMWKLGFIDFDTLFEDNYAKIPNISSCHLFKFTQEGILTKSDDLSQEYSKWRENEKLEPFKSFKGSLSPHTPSIKIPQVSEMLKKKIANDKSLPKDSKAFWNSLMIGGCGTQQPQVLNPPEFTFNSFVNRNIQLDNKSVSIQVDETDEKIEKFGKLEWSDNDKCWKLQTFYLNDMFM